jgi:hypothetical protein
MAVKRIALINLAARKLTVTNHMSARRTALANQMTGKEQS